MHLSCHDADRRVGDNLDRYKDMINQETVFAKVSVSESLEDMFPIKVTG